MEYEYSAVVWRFLSPLFSAAIVGGLAGLATLLGIRRIWHGARYRPRLAANLVAGFAAAGFIAAYLGALGLKPLGLLLGLVLILLSLVGVVTGWLNWREP
ncbi:MAG: hypothetical protein EXR62_06995 [Chloroflexi bacterium]|nr:hypothetical protein [Chloroflexota bacterium]